jgi:4-hydroxy-2-oxoheptanedioate aldolase
LALALGLAPATADRDRRWIDAVEAVRAGCARRGIAVGMHCADGQTARRYLERGFHMVTIGSDAGLLTGAVRRQVTIARRAAESAPTTGRVWPPT